MKKVIRDGIPMWEEENELDSAKEQLNTWNTKRYYPIDPKIKDQKINELMQRILAVKMGKKFKQEILYMASEKPSHYGGMSVTK